MLPTLFRQIAPGFQPHRVAVVHPRCSLLMSPWFSMKLIGEFHRHAAVQIWRGVTITSVDVLGAPRFSPYRRPVTNYPPFPFVSPPVLAVVLFSLTNSNVRF